LGKDEKAIRDFLFEAKAALSQPNRVQFIPTEKNRLALAEIGLKVADVLNVIRRLEPRDHRAGPEDDRDGSPGRVMTFLRPYCGMLLYIKLKLFDVDRATYVTILSFHEEGQHG
jgi:hypothetical protein